MTWRETARMIRHIVRNRQRIVAMDYLERNGQRFCVDFGTDDAIEKALAHRRARRRKLRGVR